MNIMSDRRQPIRFTLENSLSELERLTEHLDRVKDEWQLKDQFILQLNLALDELFTNIVSYGYDSEPKQLISFTLAYSPDEIEITMCDNGKPFDPTIPDDPDMEVPLDKKEIGGLGIFLARQYTDTLDYRRENDQNIVILTKKI